MGLDSDDSDTDSDSNSESDDSDLDDNDDEDDEKTESSEYKRNKLSSKPTENIINVIFKHNINNKIEKKSSNWWKSTRSSFTRFICSRIILLD